VVVFLRFKSMDCLTAHSLFGIRRGLEPLSHTMVSMTPVVYHVAVARESQTV